MFPGVFVGGQDGLRGAARDGEDLGPGRGAGVGGERARRSGRARRLAARGGRDLGSAGVVLVLWSISGLFVMARAADGRRRRIVR